MKKDTFGNLTKAKKTEPLSSSFVYGHDKASWQWQLSEEKSWSGLTVSEGESITVMVGSMAVGRQTWYWSSGGQLTSWNGNCVSERGWGENANWKWCMFQTLKACPQRYTSSTKAMPPNPSQTFPLMGASHLNTQAYRVPFSFKPPHALSNKYHPFGGSKHPTSLGSCREAYR